MRIHKHHFYSGLVMLVAAGIGTYFVSHLGFYPVAVVNYQPIFARDFNLVVGSAFNFYVHAIDTYKKDALTDSDAAKLYAEISRATLDKMIEERILAHELDARFGQSGLAEVDKKLSGVDNKKLGAAVSTLYGLTDEKFKKIVLEPQAQREVLTDDFKKKNEDFAAWLLSAKRSASIYVFLPGFVWGDALPQK